MTNKINQFGVELEGAWKNCPTTFEELHDSFLIEHIQSLHVGETKSSIFVLSNKVTSWIKNSYPDFVSSYVPKAREEITGLHLHQSFAINNDSYYFYLTSRAFWEYFVNEMLLFGKTLDGIDKELFEFRLTGKYDQAQMVFMPEHQVTYKNGRHYTMQYTMLAFRYHEYGSLECKLPMFQNHKTAIRAFRHYRNCIDSFLQGKPLLSAEQVSEIYADLEIRAMTPIPAFPIPILLS